LGLKCPTHCRILNGFSSAGQILSRHLEDGKAKAAGRSGRDDIATVTEHSYFLATFAAVRFGDGAALEELAWLIMSSMIVYSFERSTTSTNG